MQITIQSESDHSPRKEPAIRIRKTTKHFNKSPILRGIDLEIDKGEFVTLLGPSGCGKTTLLRIISGLEKPDGGEVYISNKLMNNIPPETRPVNMVFQSYALFPHKNVFENIAFGLRLKRLAEVEIIDSVTEALRMVRLEGFERRRVTELSGGQAQRVAVARALVNRPEVILLDEPLGALDLQLRKQMQMELRRIHSDLNMTFIYVTHDQEEALTLSDRIVLMNQGEIVQVGKPEDIYNSPNSVFSAKFIGECNIFPVKLKQSVEAGMALVDLGGNELAVKVPSGWEFREGQELHIGIRPERVRMSVDDSAQAGRDVQELAGTIVNATFLGPMKKYLVTVGSGLEVMVQEHLGQYDQPFAVGQNVNLLLKSEDILILGD